ncbi:hypothetical protein [Tepidibacillus fermentans]|uniref:Uncharacterized protein n=1 Tax=Tepidibacillus fermentans TaxID=1281767 RepID=A0A4R3KJF9_9BACI|nr:hypothetical protein [Tepidibacillus fermentans]TCS83826.1 hypothetical protein EDD72_103154 [Tepidibacillus fermentans]
MHQAKKELYLKLWNQMFSLDFQDKLAKEEILMEGQFSREIDPLVSMNMKHGRAT